MVPDYLDESSNTIPVTNAYIAEVEQEYGIHLPEMLRQYYQNDNGRNLKPSVLGIDDVPYWVENLLPMKSSGVSLEEMLKLQRLQQFPVKQMIPFADDGGGGIYYYHSGTDMVMYSHLEGEDDFFAICKGIDKFFSFLHEGHRRTEEDPYDITEITRRDQAMAKTNFLPLGSIVLLKGGTRKVMIIARGLNVKNNGETYFFDYGGVIYPDGLTGNQMVYFNQDGIIKTYFHGYSDDEDDTVLTALNEYVDSHPNVNRADPQKWVPGGSDQ